jgi:hypothetical protein
MNRPAGAFNRLVSKTQSSHNLHSFPSKRLPHESVRAINDLLIVRRPLLKSSAGWHAACDIPKRRKSKKRWGGEGRRTGREILSEAPSFSNWRRIYETDNP